MLKSILMRIWYIVSALRIRASFPYEELLPLFILVINRSGTSIVSSLLSQHPQLEGTFRGEALAVKKEGESHAHRFCDSDHIWSWLNNPRSLYE